MRPSELRHCCCADDLSPFHSSLGGYLGEIMGLLIAEREQFYWEQQSRTRSRLGEESTPTSLAYSVLAIPPPPPPHLHPALFSFLFLSHLSSSILQPHPLFSPIFLHLSLTLLSFHLSRALLTSSCSVFPDLSTSLAVGLFLPSFPTAL